MAVVPLRSGELVAVDLNAARVLWRRSVKTSLSPAVSDGRAYVESDADVFAFDLATGSSAWQAPLRGTLSAPLLAHAGWVIAGTETEAVALRGSDGAEVWRTPLASAPTARPVVSGDRVFVALADARIVAMDVKTGAVLWQQKLPERATGIAAPGDEVFVGSTDNYFYCLSERDGDRKWRWRTGADLRGAAVVDDTRVYFVSLDNVLRALNRGNGNLQWRMPLAMRPSAGPVLVDDMLVVTGQGLELRMYEVTDGARIGEYTADTPFVGSPHPQPHIEGRTLYVMTAGGELHALRYSIEPRTTPLRELPGRRIGPEPSPDSPDPAPPESPGPGA